MMKVFVVFCVVAHLTVAIVPPFTNILSGGLGGILGGGGGGGGSESEGSSSGGFSLGGSGGNPLSGLINAESGRRVLGDVLGVKINLLSALRDTVAGNQEIDISEGGEVVDGMGGGLGIEESSGGSSQAYSAGSGFSQMENSAGSYSSGQQSASNGGYVYNAPQSQSAGYAPQVQNTYGPPSTGSGYAADGGYSYNRPSANAGYAPQVQNTYGPPSAGSGYAPQVQNTYGAPSADAGYSSNGNSFNSHSTSSDAVEQRHGGATQSDSAGFSSGSSSSGHGNTGPVGGTLGALIQIPVQLLTQYRNGINRGFDGVNFILSTLGGNGGSSSNSRIDSNDLRRRFLK